MKAPERVYLSSSERSAQRTAMRAAASDPDVRLSMSNDYVDAVPGDFVVTALESKTLRPKPGEAWVVREAQFASLYIRADEPGGAEPHDAETKRRDSDPSIWTLSDVPLQPEAPGRLGRLR